MVAATEAKLVLPEKIPPIDETELREAEERKIAEEEAKIRQQVEKVRAEETGGQAEPLLATAIGRTRWGLSHIAVALGLPHVQLYNFPTSWRTG